MMSNFNLELAVNSLSFGNCSVNILKEVYTRGLNPTISLIGDKADFSSFNGLLEPAFLEWVKDRASSFSSSHKRENPSFKLWHLNGSLNSPSKEQVLFSFYELDSPTKSELNIVKNQKKLILSSQYAKKIFEAHGCSNIEYCPLGFDSLSFFKKDTKRNDENVIVFGLAGKLEKRKQHHKVLRAWSKKFGNNPKYLLNCAIKNPFLSEEQNQASINNILQANQYFNINFLNSMPSNLLYNDYLNYNDIIIGMSAGEGWGLPEFQSVCLGKHSVILNAHSYQGWANEENSVLVNPTGKVPCYDGFFFQQGSEFNQGSYFDWDEDEFISACEEAEKRFLKNKTNTNGEALAKKFTWSNTTDQILKALLEQ
jgi:glycosyltransferase involved in cell wall biosynthesis